jgi:hypothetical protein
MQQSYLKLRVRGSGERPGRLRVSTLRRLGVRLPHAPQWPGQWQHWQISASTASVHSPSRRSGPGPGQVPAARTPRPRRMYRDHATGRVGCADATGQQWRRASTLPRAYRLTSTDQPCQWAYWPRCWSHHDGATQCWQGPRSGSSPISLQLPVARALVQWQGGPAAPGGPPRGAWCGHCQCGTGRCGVAR